MKHLLGTLVVVLALSVSTAKSETSKEKGAPVSPKWSQKMQALYKNLAEIMTDVSSEKRFNDPKNHRKIEADAKRLSELAHDMVKFKDGTPDHDPTLMILGNEFRNETKRAYLEFKRGNRAYSRSLLRSIPGYCIACHTRNDSGPSFSALPLKPAVTQLSHLDLGQFYAATRQFDLALKEFAQVYTMPSDADVVSRTKAVRYALAITIRVKNDLAGALEVVEKVISSREAPFFFRETALKWRESIRSWQQELPRKPTSEDGLFAEATRLIAQARASQQGPIDESSAILYFRASALLHDLLAKAPQGSLAAQALLMQGICYESLQDMHIWDFHEFYYEACIYRSPHSEIAQSCFKRYQESVYFGFTGSAGTQIPEDVQRHYAELEALAAPVPGGGGLK